MDAQLFYFRELVFSFSHISHDRWQKKDSEELDIHGGSTPELTEAPRVLHLQHPFLIKLVEV